MGYCKYWHSTKGDRAFIGGENRFLSIKDTYMLTGSLAKDRICIIRRISVLKKKPAKTPIPIVIRMNKALFLKVVKRFLERNSGLK